MKKWYEKDEGKTILYGEPEDVAKTHPTAIAIPDKPDPDSIWEGGRWISDPTAYARKRVAEYPEIGVQLDALLKQFKLMDGSLELCPDMQSIISSWEEVKAKYPKPEESK
jgi:hypothetical protein